MSVIDDTGTPTFRRGHAPAHLRSKTQLRRALRLDVAPGQRPVCYVLPYYHPNEPCALYDPADAVPLPEMSLGAAWAWRTRRTCHQCGEQREYIIRGDQCGVCHRADRERLQERESRTCDGCRRVGEKPYPEVVEGWYRRRYCRFCTAGKRRQLAALLAEAIRCPDGCGTRTATKKRVLDWASREHRAVAHWQRRRCAPHDAEHRAQQERLEAERAAQWERRRAAEQAEIKRRREARRLECGDLEAWAAEVLADPDAVILDTETTGLDHDARIVEIAVVTIGGEVLLDTRLNPGGPIPDEASAIHGITDADVADAPTFTQILPALTEATRSRRVLIYNESYDVERLRHELTLHHEGDVDPAASASAWLKAIETEDAMIPYSDWVGEWSKWHGNYRWQPLGGTHGARGDCLAVIERLREMARSSESR